MTYKTDLVLGKGEVYFDLIDPSTGKLTGERYIGNTPEFALTRSVQGVQVLSSADGIKSEASNVTTQQIHKVAFTTDNISVENTALWYGGDADLVAQTPLNGLVDTVTVKRGRHYQLGVATSTPLGRRNVTVTSFKIGTTTVAASNFEVDEYQGRVFVKADADVSLDGASLKITYNAASALSHMTASEGHDQVGAVRFISRNPVGTQKSWYFPRVRIEPQGNSELKGANWQTLSFTGTVQRKSALHQEVYVDEVAGQIPGGYSAPGFGSSPSFIADEEFFRRVVEYIAQLQSLAQAAVDASQSAGTGVSDLRATVNSGTQTINGRIDTALAGVQAALAAAADDQSTLNKARAEAEALLNASESSLLDEIAQNRGQLDERQDELTTALVELQAGVAAATSTAANARSLVFQSLRDGWLTDPVFEDFTVSGNLAADKWTSTGVVSHASKIAGGRYGTALYATVPDGSAALFMRASSAVPGQMSGDPNAEWVVMTLMAEIAAGDPDSGRFRAEWRPAGSTTWVAGDIMGQADNLGRLSDLGFTVQPGVVQSREFLVQRPAGMAPGDVSLFLAPKVSTEADGVEITVSLANIRAASETEIASRNPADLEAAITEIEDTIVTLTSALASRINTLEARANDLNIVPNGSFSGGPWITFPGGWSVVDSDVNSATDAIARMPALNAVLMPTGESNAVAVAAYPVNPSDEFRSSLAVYGGSVMLRFNFKDSGGAALTPVDRTFTPTFATEWETPVWAVVEPPVGAVSTTIALHRLAGAGDAYVTSISVRNLNALSGSAEARITDVENAIVTINDEGDPTSIASRLNSVEAAAGTNNARVTTVENAVSSLEGEAASLASRVSTIEAASGAGIDFASVGNLFRNPSFAEGSGDFWPDLTPAVIVPRDAGSAFLAETTMPTTHALRIPGGVARAWVVRESIPVVGGDLLALAFDYASSATGAGTFTVIAGFYDATGPVGTDVNLTASAAGVTWQTVRANIVEVPADARYLDIAIVRDAGAATIWVSNFLAKVADPVSKALVEQSAAALSSDIQSVANQTDTLSADFQANASAVQTSLTSLADADTAQSSILTRLESRSADGNIVPQPRFEPAGSRDQWSGWTSSLTVVQRDTGSATAAIRTIPATYAATVVPNGLQVQAYAFVGKPCSLGEKIHVAMAVACGGTNPNQTFEAIITWRDGNNVALPAVTARDYRTYTHTSTAWSWVEFDPHVVPTDAATFSLIIRRRSGGVGTGYFTNVTCRKGDPGVNAINARLTEEYFTQADTQQAIAALETTLSASIGGATTSASAALSAVNDINGRQASMVAFKTTGSGGSASVTVASLADGNEVSNFVGIAGSKILLKGSTFITDVTIGDFQNYIPDDQMVNRGAWTSGSGGNWRLSSTAGLGGAAPTSAGMFLLEDRDPSGVARIDTELFPLGPPGSRYHITYQVRGTSTGVYRHRIALRTHNSNGEYAGGTGSEWVTSSSTVNRTFTHEWTAPDDATLGYFALEVDNAATTCSVVRFFGVKLKRMSGGTDIRDGGVTTNHLVAKAVTADKADFNSLTALNLKVKNAEIENLSVTTGKLGDNSATEVSYIIQNNNTLPSFVVGSWRDLGSISIATTPLGSAMLNIRYEIAQGLTYEYYPTSFGVTRSASHRFRVLRNNQWGWDYVTDGWLEFDVQAQGSGSDTYRFQYILTLPPVEIVTSSRTYYRNDNAIKGFIMGKWAMHVVNYKK